MLFLHIQTRQGSIKRIELEPSSTMGCALDVQNDDLKRLCEQWIECYLNHKKLPMLPLDYSNMTPFTQKVLFSLLKIPFGSVDTYLNIAGQAGSPKACRAVGNVCSKNPFPLVIPCHRVVGKGHLGGFRYGLEMKKQLLKFESPTQNVF
jgi:methylated-DNA-[protein]-cysteine S-methyltransferase